MKKRYPPTYFNTAIILMIAFHFLIPIIDIITAYWRLLGIVPILIGIYLNLAADKSMKVSNTTVKPGEQSEILIKDGVFKLSRNPMYLGMTLILFGIAVIWGSLSPFFVVIVFVYSIKNLFIKVEESMLKKKFKVEWMNYKKRTRRWI